MKLTVRKIGGIKRVKKGHKKQEIQFEFRIRKGGKALALQRLRFDRNNHC